MSVELTEFVLSQLPPVPARVLEVGCGAVVASLSLHHVEDLGGVLDKLVRLLRGPLILNEHAWDRLEPMTPEWEEEHAGLHGYAQMRPELDARFEERFFEWRPYPVDGEDVPRLGFRYAGEPR